MKDSKRLIACILLLAALAGLYLAANRMRIESAARTVQIVMDYSDLRDRAAERRYNLSYLLQKLKENGLGAVALREVNLADLIGQGRVTAVTGSTLIDDLRLTGDNASAAGVKPGDTYILTADPDLHTWLAERFSQRLGPTRVSELTLNSKTLLVLAADRDGAAELRLGFAASDLAAVQAAGLPIVPVFSDYDLVTADYITNVFAQLGAAGPLPAVLFEGREALGYPQHLGVTAGEMNARDAVFGLIQASGTLPGYVKLSGMEQLLTQTNYRAVRVYQISRKETNNIREKDMIERWVTSVKENNVRLLYLRPFYLPTSEEEEVWRNLNYVRDLKIALAQAGFETGQASPFTPYFVPESLLILLLAGVVAGGLLLLRDLGRVSDRFVYTALVLTPIVYRIASALGQIELLRTAAAVAGAVVFAALSVATVLQNPYLTAGRTKNRLAQLIFALRLWLNATAVTLLGAVIVTGLLGNVRYILELEFFRGVKVLYVAPLLLVILAWLWGSVYARERGADWRRELRAGLDSHISLRGLLLFGAALAVGAIYLLRSGDVGAISPVEWSFRTSLEELLLARPRTKEFLIGHPALIVAIAASVRGYRRYLLPLFVLGAVGQLSVLNTFVHIRTPLFLSLVRTANGIWLGALVGTALVLAGNWISDVWEKRLVNKSD